MGSLHKKFGVRGLDLMEVRRSDLGRHLHVHPHDDEWHVLAKIVWQVDRAIRRATRDEKNRDILRYAYNTPRDSALNALWLLGRLDLLAARRGKGWARSTTNKVAPKLAESVVRELQRALPAPDGVELAELVEAERDYGRAGTGRARIQVDESHLSNLIDEWNTSRRDEIEYWLERWELHFEVESGCLVTMRTADRGEYLCVFTSAERLAEYQRLAGHVPGRAARSEGVHLLGRLAGTPGVGLAVDPVVGGTGSTYWTAGEVARRWAAAGEG